MPETATRKRNAPKRNTPKKQSGASGESRSANSGMGKAMDHLAEAIKGVASRVVFVSEADHLNVLDHLDAAVNDARGNKKEADAARKRIEDRTPDES